MEKRFLAFLAIAFSLLMANALISAWLWPQQPAAEVVQQEPDAAAVKPKPATPEDKPKEAGDLGAQPDAASKPKESAEGAEKTARGENGKSTEDKQPGAPEPAPPAEPPKEQWLTLGSVDPDSPYRMLVTLTNRGAAIRRMELSSHRFSDIDDRSGYLGHLEAETTSKGGARIRVVGAGTPAAAAGLQPGDVLKMVGDQPIHEADDLRFVLSKTKPRQKVDVTYQRTGKDSTVAVYLTRRPLEVTRPERENFWLRHENVPDGFEDPASLLFTLERINDKKVLAGEQELVGLNLRDGNWEITERDETSVTFHQSLPEQQLDVYKRYRLAKVPAEFAQDQSYEAYHIDLEVDVVNRADHEQQVAYRLDGPTGLPIEGWWYAAKVGRGWGSSGLRDLAVWFEGNSAPATTSASSLATEAKVSMLGKPLMYAGVDAQYFASVLVPQQDTPEERWIDETQGLRVGPEPSAKANKQLTNITCRLISKTRPLAPGQSLKNAYRVFAGPKRPDLLAKYYAPINPIYNLGELVYYGWFGPVAKAMLGVLHFFYGIVGNYGIAIILLTVLVRGCMFPLSKKQALNMAKMQELQPEMKRIQEKYKKDLEKRTKAQQDLFRKHSYNPMGGCMLMFLQLPIFVGLYRSLSVDVELRQAPLISDAIRWCSNLAAPDMLFNWSGIMPDFINSGVGLFGLGPYFNLLPLLTVGLFLWQQKMFMPPPADEQQALQQKMMKYMMVFFAFMFFKVASGLCLYFIASSLWGIAERKLLPKSVLAKDASDASPEKAIETTAPSTNGIASQNKKRSKPKRRM